MSSPRNRGMANLRGGECFVQLSSRVRQWLANAPQDAETNDLDAPLYIAEFDPDESDTIGDYEEAKKAPLLLSAEETHLPQAGDEPEQTVHSLEGEQSPSVINSSALVLSLAHPWFTLQEAGAEPTASPAQQYLKDLKARAKAKLGVDTGTPEPVEPRREEYQRRPLSTHPPQAHPVPPVTTWCLPVSRWNPSPPRVEKPAQVQPPCVVPPWPG